MVKASISIAQGCFGIRLGRSELAAKYNNFWRKKPQLACQVLHYLLKSSLTMNGLPLMLLFGRMLIGVVR